MSVKWEKEEGTNNGKLTFEIEPAKIKEGLDVAFNRVKKSLNVPGFRKGKVPRQIFNKMFGEESLYQDALNAVLPEAYTNAVKESDIKPVDQPEIDVESMEKDSAWVLTAKVTVEPEVELGEYKGLEVAAQSTEVTDEDVDAELNRMREQQAELVLKEDAPAEKGDTVVIDFNGTIDGVPFEGGKSENYSLELGSNTFIPGFEDQLVGHKADEDVDVKVTFPEDYQAEDLQGKEAVFATKIHEVKAKELPELDDDFAKDVDEEVETLVELKAKVREELENNKIPTVMIDEDVHRQMEQYLGGMQQQGISADMYYKLTGTTEEDLHKQFEEGAAKRVKTNLVLEAIVAAEGVTATEEEIDKEIKELAAQYGMDEKAVRSALSDDMLNHDISIRKVVDEITDSAKQVEKD